MGFSITQPSMSIHYSGENRITIADCNIEYGRQVCHMFKSFSSGI